MGRIALLVLLILATACTAGQTAAAPTPTIHYTPEPTATPTPAPSITPVPSPTATPAPDWNALPVVANDPGALAAQIKMVEDALRDPKVQGAQLAYMGHLQQLAYSRLADYPEWQPAVLAALPQYSKALSDALDAGKNLRSMNGAVPTRLPDWKIVAPKPIDALLSYYKEAEATYGIEWQYLAAINLVETRMGRIRGLSEAGAQGPMQFMPPTWAQYGRGDVNDDHDAILGAARYLKAAGAPANMQKALFAYNHAQAYVNALVDYADAMKADPNEYRGYWGWQVYYPTKDGPVLLATGWTKE